MTFKHTVDFDDGSNKANLSLFLYKQPLLLFVYDYYLIRDTHTMYFSHFQGVTCVYAIYCNGFSPEKSIFNQFFETANLRASSEVRKLGF